MADRQGVGRDDLDECWCCDGLHDSLGALCPDCDDSGCQHFGGECQSDHNPVLPDGGRPGVDDDHGQTHRHLVNIRGHCGDETCGICNDQEDSQP